MGWFDFITGGDKSKIIEGGLDLAKMAGKGIDALYYTDEEKAENAMKITEGKTELIKSINDHVRTTYKENSIRSITRRYLAWVIIGNGILLSWASLLSYAVGAYYTGYGKGVIQDDKNITAQAWFNVSNQAWQILGFWGVAIGSVIICYFGYYGISNIVSKVRKKTPAQ